VRLDRFFSHTTGLSRSQAQRAIRAGDVRVNGIVAKDAASAVAAGDAVTWRDAPVAAPAPCYFMLHKPPGVVCATRDPEHRTVLDLLDVANKKNLQVVGRLDIDATGLVLLTDDGAWLHRVTAPKRQVEKVYRVTLAEPLTPQAAADLQNGIQLKNEKERCAPAALEPLTETEARLTITEGKYHQVKRMFAAVGNHVLTLHRERIGTVVLDPNLAVGTARPLTTEEVTSFEG
jgi:16S rRNA pseudouridine516 synthase